MRTDRISQAFAAAAAAVFAMSCTKGVPGERFSITVGLDDGEPKTVLSAPDGQNRHHIYWENGDRVSVGGNVSNALTGAGASDRKASFSFPSAITVSDNYNILYPGDYDDAVVFDGKSMPMYASCTSLDGTIGLEPLASVLRFSLKGNVSIGRIVLKTVGEEYIGGTFSMGKTSGKYTGRLTPSPGASDCVDVHFDNRQLSASTEEYFFIPIPAQTYFYGIKAEIFDTAGNSMAVSFWGSRKEALAGTAYHLPAISFEPSTNWIVSDDGSLASESVTLDKTVKIKACTFNIWVASARNSAAVGPDRSKLLWNQGYKAVASCIAANAPDVIGLNEVGADAYLTSSSTNIRSLLPEYSWVIFASSYWPPKDPDKIPTPSSMGTGVAILYRPDRLSLVCSNGFWLTSADPDRGIKKSYTVPSTDSLYTRHCYDDGFGRVAGGKYKAYTNRPGCYACFKHKESGKVFWVFAIHQDLTSFNGPATTEKPTGYRSISDHSAQCTNSRSAICHARRLVPEGTPSIIMGDMNTTTGGHSYEYYLTSGSWYAPFDADSKWEARDLPHTPGRWSDAYEVVAKREGKYLKKGLSICTMNNKDNATYNDWRPDHILVDGFGILSYGVDRNKYPNASGQDIFPSDHFLVRTLLTF